MKKTYQYLVYIILLLVVISIVPIAHSYVIEEFCLGTITQVTPNSLQLSIREGEAPAIGISGKVAVEIETEFQGVKSKTWLDVAKVTVTQSSSSTIRCSIDEHIKNSYGVSPEQYMQQPNNTSRIQWRLAQ
ncbi:MAG: hypothetical protein JNL36_04615 [Candidatus Kapabacteria bacterium]|nr:hypothetical protein [Candidatus Kapabacteria bacterium]